MPWDGMFVTLAVLDVLSVIGLALVALRLVRTGRNVGARVSPAAAHARRTAEVGRRFALQARQTATGAVTHARELAARVQKRIATTRHLIRELKPAPEVDTRALVRSAQTNVARGKEWAGRLSRLHRAGRSASNKNRAPNAHS
jgi:hypothetical protein